MKACHSSPQFDFFIPAIVDIKGRDQKDTMDRLLPIKEQALEAHRVRERP